MKNEMLARIAIVEAGIKKCKKSISADFTPGTVLADKYSRILLLLGKELANIATSIDLYELQEQVATIIECKGVLLTGDDIG